MDIFLICTFLPIGTQTFYLLQSHQTPYNLSQALRSAWSIMGMTEHKILPR